MSTRRCLRGSLLSLALLLGGCGGDDWDFLTGDFGDPPRVQPTSPTRQILFSTASLDGMVFNTGAGVTLGGRPMVGDLDTTLQGSHARQFFSFELGSLPSSITLVSARLELHQATVRGTPFATLGNVVLEAVDYGTSLEAGDFDVAPLSGGALGLSTDPTLGTKQLDVLPILDDAVQQGRPRWQIRLRFSALGSDADHITDAVEFGDAETSTPGSLAPRLIVEFRQP